MEFIVLLVGRVVSLFRGTVLSNEVTINDQDREATISVTISLTGKRNVTVADWHKAATQVSELSQALGKFGSMRSGGPSPFMYTPAPPPLALAECNRCRRWVDPLTGWTLRRDWPPVGTVCPACFGSSPSISADGGSHLSSDSTRSDERGTAGPLSPCEQRGVDKRARGTLSSVALAGVATDAGGLAPLASDARRIPSGVSTPADSSFGVGR